MGATFALMDYFTDPAKEIKAAVQGMQGAMNQTASVDPLHTFAKSIDKIKPKLESLRNHAMILTGVFTALLVGITAPAIGISSQFEEYETQYEVLLGSAEAATTRMQEITKYPFSNFGLDQIANADKILTAFGIRSIEQLRLIGDAAKGSGKNIDEVALTFGQISAGTFGEAFMRLTKMGITTQKDLEMQGLKFDKGGAFQGSATQAMEAVNKIVETKFGGMMEKQSKTWSGMMSNVKVMMTQFFLGLGKDSGLFDAVKSDLRGLLDFIVSVDPKKLGAEIGEGLNKVYSILKMIISPFTKFVEWITWIIVKTPGAGEALGFMAGAGSLLAIATGLVVMGFTTLALILPKVVEGIDFATKAYEGWQKIGGLTGVFSYIKTGFIGAAQAVWGFTVALLANPVTWIIIGVIALGGAIYLLIKHWDTLKEVFGTAFKPLSDALSELKSSLGGLWNSFSDLFETIFGPIITIVKPYLDIAIQKIREFISPLFELADGGWLYNIGFAIGFMLGEAIAFVAGVATTITEFITGVVNRITEIITTITGFLQEGDILGAVKYIFTTVFDYLASIGEFFFNAGSGLLNALIDGIKSKVGDAVDAVKGVVGSVRDYLPFSDAKVGPLSNLTESGGKLVETIATGMESQKTRLSDSLKNALQVTIPGPKTKSGESADAKQIKSSSNGRETHLHFHEGAIVLPGVRSGQDFVNELIDAALEYD